jgi:nucleoside-diphosphate-sugar epimerase
VDALDRDDVLTAVRAARPDAAIHQLTALSGGSPNDNAHLRRIGTRNLVDAARTAGVVRMVAQSIAWAYAAGDTPAREECALDLQAPQPRATTIAGVKALEDAVSELPHHVILRYGTLYGPNTWFASGGLMADRLGTGNLAANDAVSSFVHVRDAARAAVQALDWPRGPVNVVDDEPAPAAVWVPHFAQAVGATAPPRSTGRAEWERGASNALARSRGLELEFPSWTTGFFDELAAGR